MFERIGEFKQCKGQQKRLEDEGWKGSNALSNYDRSSQRDRVQLSYNSRQGETLLLVKNASLDGFEC